MTGIIDRLRAAWNWIVEATTPEPERYRCPNCGEVLNSHDHARNVPPGAPSKMPGTYWNCPNWLTGKHVRDTGCGGKDMRTWDLDEYEEEDADDSDTDAGLVERLTPA